MSQSQSEDSRNTDPGGGGISPLASSTSLHHCSHSGSSSSGSCFNSTSSSYVEMQRVRTCSNANATSSSYVEMQRMLQSLTPLVLGHTMLSFTMLLLWCCARDLSNSATSTSQHIRQLLIQPYLTRTHGNLPFFNSAEQKFAHIRNYITVHVDIRLTLNCGT